MPPGSTIGILGGGQLGRMMALAGRQMGYRFVTLDPTPDSPCGQVSDEQIVAAYDDVDAARRLAALSDVITYEFENVDVKVASILESESHVPQGSELLRITRHRLREKSTLQSIGVPVTTFRPVSSLDTLQAAADNLGFPCVLKTTTGGYDGKGQWLIRNRDEIAVVWREVESLAAAGHVSTLGDAAGSTAGAEANRIDSEFILEQFVRFTKEISVIVARSPRGEVRSFPVSENIHRHHILHLSILPARISEAVESAARSIAERIAEQFSVIGLIAVEMFVTEWGEVWVNELAPRPHNSGHYSIDACATSQFEQHIRAICNLPLGPVQLLTPVVMVNVLGQHVKPVMDQIADIPGDMKLHLYGKQTAKTDRKMGHINVIASQVETALANIDELGVWRD